MKTREKVMSYFLLPFKIIWHYAKKSAKYLEKKSKPAMAMLMAVIMLCGMLPATVFATGEAVNIGDTYADEPADLTVLASTYSDALEVNEDSGVITVKLLKDVEGRIEFAISGANIIFDANGKSFSGGEKNQAISLVHYKEVTVELIGNGSYTTGAHNTVYVGRDNTLIIKSATVNGKLVNDGGTVKTALQSGYDIYTVKKNDVDVYSEEFNTEEKTLTAYPGSSDILTVQQLEAPSYTVSFDRNGGFSGNMSDVTDVYGEYVLPACKFTAWSTQYFKAWNVNGVEKQPGDIIKVTEDITIKAIWQDKDYGVTVGGVKVTYQNASDVTGTNITGGKVSYDLATKTLTLDNVTVAAGEFLGGTLTSAIHASGSLTIHLVGDNTVNGAPAEGESGSSHQYAINSYGDITFTGEGSLNVTAADGGTFSYAISGSNITVGSDCTITAVSGVSDFAMCALSCDTFTATGSTVLASQSITASPLASFDELGKFNSKYVKIMPAYNITVSFDAGDGTGTMDEEEIVCSKEYILPESGFIAPEGKQFKAWSVKDSEKSVGDKVYFVEDTTITAVWEDVPGNDEPGNDEPGNDEPTPEGPEKEYLLGDANGDGKVDADDYILLKRVVFGMAKLENQPNPETALARSDVHGDDGRITADDYIFLKRVYFGMATLG